MYTYVRRVWVFSVRLPARGLGGAREKVFSSVGPREAKSAISTTSTRRRRRRRRPAPAASGSVRNSRPRMPLFARTGCVTDYSTRTPATVFRDRIYLFLKSAISLSFSLPLSNVYTCVSTRIPRRTTGELVVGNSSDSPAECVALETI